MGGRSLRRNRTQTHVDDRPGQLRRFDTGQCAEVVRGGVADHGRPDPLPGRRRAMSVGGAEHRGKLGQERARHRLACPHVSPTAFELTGQGGHDIRTGHVLMQHFDRGTVAALVNLAEQGGRGLAILRRRCAFGDRELKAHREVELLGVSGADPLPAALEFEDREPCCGAAQFGCAAHDQFVHCRSGLRGDHRGRIQRVGPQPQHQRVDDALDGPGQRSAVVTAEHLDAGPDRPPRRLDHRPAWMACRHGGGQLRIRTHQHRIGALPRYRQPKSWVR